MAADRIITTGFWDDPDFEDVPYLEKFIYVFLFSAPASAVCGYFLCTYKRISEGTGMPLELVKDSVIGLQKKEKIVFDSGFVFVKGMARRQKAENQNYFSDHCKKQFRDGYKPGNKAFEAFMEFYGIKDSKTPNPNKISDEKEGVPKESRRDYEGTTKGSYIRNTLQDSNSSFERGVGKTFLKPSPEEVIQEFRTRGHPEPETEGNKFYNFYESKNWMIGKNKMKNWKAAVAGWISRQKEFSQNRHTQNGKPKPANTESITPSLERLRKQGEAIEQRINTG